MTDPEGTSEIILEVENDEAGPTSDLNPDEPVTEDETPETQEEKKDEPETPPAQAVDWDSDDNPYKKRHGDSQREVNENLLPKIKESEAKLAQLQKERDEALARLKEEQPEAYDNLTLQKAVEQSNRQLAELKESVELDRFISATPEAASFREALKQHARAFPTKSLNDIWREAGFSDVAAARKVKTETVTKERKDTRPEKGSVTPEPGRELIGGHTLEQFNKLPLEKRREILMGMGAKV